MLQINCDVGSPDALSRKVPHQEMWAHGHGEYVEVELHLVFPSVVLESIDVFVMDLFANSVQRHGHSFNMFLGVINGFCDGIITGSEEEHDSDIIHVFVVHHVPKFFWQIEKAETQSHHSRPDRAFVREHRACAIRRGRFVILRDW